MKLKQIFVSSLCLVIASVSLPLSAKAQFSSVRTIVFPVLGTSNYYDDFGNPRSGGRLHEGNDIFAPKMRALVAAVDGTVVSVNYPEATWGMAVTIRDSDGYTYHYLHMNNDTPGTDDGGGDGMNAYGPDIQQGNRVVKGQLIGYIGDSGNAETTPPHLHFEIRQPDRTAISPFQSLQNATRISEPVKNYPAQENEILPFENFEGGSSVAVANLNSNDDMEYVVGAVTGGGPLVKTFDKAGKQLAAFYAYDPNFRGGVDVAAADVDDDGVAEIITAPGARGGPHGRIFKANGNPITTTKVKDFFAYDPSFSGGVNISAADMDDDGVAEIVTGPKAGGGPHVRVFRPDGTVINEMLAYGADFRGGVDVAAIPSGPLTSSRRSRVVDGGFVTAPGAGGGPHIKAFGQDGAMASEFFAYDENFNLGVRISAGEASSSNSGREIAVIPATGGGPHVKMFGLTGETLFSNFRAFESWWRGGYDISIYEDGASVSSIGGRRASVRQVNFSTRTTNRDRDRR
ncbi:MAG TPA: M23 family metallopeptidase [Candidatus Doudnabacteria bacterium]|nr:M23 family metallopeptidase [Candidatus Doudnabacteria bacterium]